jgi:predicted GNAT family acetyltransferase
MSENKVDLDSLKLHDNQHHHRYEFALDGAHHAIITYKLYEEAKVIVLLHTEVPEQFGGQGIANKLIHDVLEDCIARGLKIAPSCPFVAAYIKRHPVYQPMTVPVEDD